MAQHLTDIQKGTEEAQRLADLAREQAKFPAGTEFTPGTATPVPQTAGFNVPTPTGAIPADFLTELQKSREELRKFQGEFLASFQVSPEETRSTEELEQLRLAEVQQQAGQLGREKEIREKGVLAPFTEGELARSREQLALEQKRLATQILPLEMRLQRLQQGRQTKAEILKAHLGFAEKEIDIAREMQKLTQPDVKGIRVNEETGDTFAFILQPNGQVTSQKIGNIGAKAVQEFDAEGSYTGSRGNKVVYGTNKKTGKFEERILGKEEVSTTRDVQTLTIGGRLIEIIRDRKTGQEISRRDLGPSGETTRPEIKTFILQELAKAQPQEGETRGAFKTRLEQYVRLNGGSPTDEEIRDAVDSAGTKVKGFFRRLLGF